MEYKVFLYWSKNEKPEVRRFTVDLESSCTILKFHEKLLSICPRLQGKVYSIMWKDEEGDDIIISTDEELCTAQGHMGVGVKKVYIYLKDDEFDDDEIKDVNVGEDDKGNEMQHDFAGDKVQHNGVVCDSCNGPVVGFRYKCAVCPDYDLCTTCESAGSHPEHCMVRVPLPTLPRDIVRAALKRSRYFLKTVISEKACEDLNSCPYKSRRERSGAGPSGDRKHHRGHRHEERQRRPRASWLDTFTTYMNEFANLAGDPELNTTNLANQASNGATNKPSAPPAPNQEQKKGSAENAPPNTPKEPATPNSCPFSGGEILIDDIQKMFQLYLSGGLNAFIPKQTADQVTKSTAEQATTSAEQATTSAEQATTSAEQGSTTVKQATSTEQASPSAGPLNDVEMDQAERAPSQSKSDNMTGGSNDKSEFSPDRADDWTVINKEKDLMDSYVKSDGHPILAPEIGFNLPQQFQEQVSVSQGQSLYPPLNAATAVLNPKVPETIPAAVTAQAAAPSAPQAQPTLQPTPQPTPQQTPKRQILKPHIAAALQQMLAMGFTNDGGWLTQLLENKDGNIAAVLDLLTPVTPKKN